MTPTLFLLFALLFARGPQGDVVPVAISAPPTEPAAATLAPYRIELLHQAFEVVSKLPTVPHAKNRARAQEAVFVTCLELDQPELAAGFAERIDNWRQASAFGDLALYHAEHNQAIPARKFLEAARKGVETSEDQDTQWRRDRVLVKVAAADQVLTRIESPKDSGTTSASLQTQPAPDADQVRVQLRSLPEIAKAGDLESLQQAMLGAVELYQRCMDQPALREEVYQAICGTWTRLPGLMRVDLAFGLVTADLEHHDLAQAKSKLDDTQSMMEGMVWEVRHRVPALARLAQLRQRAGQAPEARDVTAGALELYRTSRSEVIDIYRTKALVPVAEAWMAQSDRAAAEAVYELALAEALVNPNSKPRAEDLSAILCSMAKAGFEPSQAWSERCTQAIQALSNPW